MIPALSEIRGEWKATSSSRNERPTTPMMNTGMRPFMYSLWSSSAAVTPPTSTVMPEPPSGSGTTSSRSRLTRSSVSLSWGEPFGITVISAASPLGVDPRRRDEGDPGLAAKPLREGVHVWPWRPGRAARRRSPAARSCRVRSPRCSGRRPGGSWCPAGRCPRRGSRGACRARAPPAPAAARWRRSRRSRGAAGRRGSSARPATRRCPPSSSLRPRNGIRRRSTFGPR